MRVARGDMAQPIIMAYHVQPKFLAHDQYIIGVII